MIYVLFSEKMYCINYRCGAVDRKRILFSLHAIYANDLLGGMVWEIRIGS